MIWFIISDQFNRTKQILSGIENISYVCIGSSLIFGILSIGGLDIKGKVVFFYSIIQQCALEW